MFYVGIVGYGKMGKIYEEEIKKTKERAIVQLNVNRHNNALNFYLKHGFSIIHEEDNDIGEGYFMNDYVMQRDV